MLALSIDFCICLICGRHREASKVNVSVSESGQQSAVSEMKEMLPHFLNVPYLLKQGDATLSGGLKNDG